MKVTAVLAFGLLGCNDDKDTTGDTGAAGAFAVLGDADSLPPAALLAVWGTSDQDVFIVGSDDGTGPVVLHWDGSAWSRLQTGTTGDLWWVWSDGGDVVWMVGQGGRVVTYTRSTGGFAEEVIADPAYNLFGVWGSSATDLYVAASQNENALDGAIYHYDGTSWALSTLVPRKDEYPTPPPGGAISKRQAFKVWGSGPNDVWAVGTQGMAMHFDGTAWEDIRPEPIDNTTTLVTISGSGPNLAYAVGGFGNADVARWDGTTWTDESPTFPQIVPFFNGVNVSGDLVVACGGGGSIYWRGETQWDADPRPVVTGFDFHACWLDDQGAVWAVGGDLTTQTAGVIVYGGDQVLPVADL